MRRHRRKCRRKRANRPPRRLFLRVYLYGVLLLVAVVVSIGFASHIVNRGNGPPNRYLEAASFVDEEITPLLDEPSQLDDKLQRIRRHFKADVAVYSSDGELLASAGTAPEPLDEVPIEPEWITHGAAVPLDGGRAYAVARADKPWGEGWRWLLVPLTVLVVLALVTLPLARNIVRPIEQVTQAAQALGQGQLDVRTGVVRRPEVGVLAKAFDDMAARLERLVAGEKELRANVSHELRTPLARMRVALEIAEEGAQNRDTLEKHLRGIRRDLAELEELVDQVLITARLDLASDDELALRREITMVSELGQEAARRFRETHGDHHLELRDDTDGARINADTKLVRRVIDNLLENSAKYSAPSDGPITLLLERPLGSVRVTVRDHGIGVAKAEIDRLFEPFFRATSIRADPKGVGLGLSFCKRVIEAHDGEISARLADPSDEASGLVVQFTLPTV